MKRASLALLLTLAFAGYASAEDWKNVSIVDTQCSTKVKADPDAHTRSCALACGKSGFGILDSQGHYLKFDQKGNQEATQILQNTTKRDHLRVDVSGTKEGDVIHVNTMHLL